VPLVQRLRLLGVRAGALVKVDADLISDESELLQLDKYQSHTSNLIAFKDQLF
jgi:hypothetical protein